MSGLRALRAIGNRLRTGDGPGLVQSMLRRSFRGLKGRYTVHDFDGSLTMTLDLAEHMQRRIFWMGYYNLHLVPVLDQMLVAGMVVVDVGANIGEVTLLAARRVGPGGRVIAFEPSPTVASELDAHVRSNDLQQVVQVRRQGLADQVGSLPLYVSYGQGVLGEENRGLASLHGSADSDSLIGIIEVTTLDEVALSLPLERLDLLKVDIEGGELACLRGAMATLHRFKPVIAIEVQHRAAAAAGYQGKDILDLLAPLGYRFYRLEARGQLVSIDAGQLVAYQDVLCVAGARRSFEP